MLYAGVLWRFRDSIRPREAGHELEAERGSTSIGFLYRSYRPAYYAWEVVDSVRRVALTGFLVFVPERGRAACGALLAFFFYGLQENTRPFCQTSHNAIASMENATVAIVLMLLAFLQGELVQPSLVATLSIVLASSVVPGLLVTQLANIRNRRVMLAALESTDTTSPDPSSTSAFEKTFAQGCVSLSSLESCISRTDISRSGDAGAQQARRRKHWSCKKRSTTSTRSCRRGQSASKSGAMSCTCSPCSPITTTTKSSSSE